jgi:hypothetical protein
LSVGRSRVLNMKLIKARLIVGLVLALSVIGAPSSLADDDPFPGVAYGAEIGARQSVSPSTGNPLDGSPIISCPSGAGLAAVAGGGSNYVVCTKTWRPSADVAADAAFQKAQRDATAASEAESKAWAEAHPGQQKCIQWGPIVHANGVSTASGGVCANPVPVPSGYVADTSTVGSGNSAPIVESATPVVAPSPAPSAQVNTNGFGGYAVVHPDGHVCGVIVSGSSDPFNNGGVMPQEYMGCPSGSRIVFQSAPSADGNVAGWHGENVVLSGNTYSLPGGSTINNGIVTDPNGRTWNSGTGAVINPGVVDTRTVLSDTSTVLSDTATVSASQTLIAPLTAGADTATAIDDLSALPEVEAEVEPSTSIQARIVGGKTRIEVVSDYVATKMTVVATKKGSKKKYTYRITTNSEGALIFKSSVNLKGFTLVIYKDGEELDRDSV